MNNFEPILIKPLKFRGIFGITWMVYKRGLISMLVFTLLLTTIIMLAMGALNFGNFDFIEQIEEFQNFDFDFNTNLIVDTSAVSDAVPFKEPFPGDLQNMLGTVLSSFVLSSLVSLLSLVNLLVLQPMYQGSVYTEMSRRIYGEVSSLRNLLSRCGSMLKRFFTTYLSYYVVIIVFSIAVGLIFMILFFVVAFSAAFSIITSTVSTGLIISVLLFILIFIAAMLIGPMLMSFVFPVAVNENINNFKAVGRSFKLVGKRFWRVLSANLVVGVVVYPLLALLITAILIFFFSNFSIAEDIESLRLMSMIIYGLEALVSLFLLPYSAALNTVLYFDTRVRAEGEGWLNYPKTDGSEPALSDENAAYEEGFVNESKNEEPDRDNSDDQVNTD